LALQQDSRERQEPDSSGRLRGAWEMMQLAPKAAILPPGQGVVKLRHFAVGWGSGGLLGALKMNSDSTVRDAQWATHAAAIHESFESFAHP
jgi:hypothetical protein